MKYLENIAKHYFPVWTSDGIDDFHADAKEIEAWLKREDLRTSSDAALEDLTDDEIAAVAEMIAEMVRNANS